MLKATSYVIQKKSALKQLYQKKKNSIEITISVLPPPSKASALALSPIEGIA